jgi:hypothetical protein
MLSIRVPGGRVVNVRPSHVVVAVVVVRALPYAVLGPNLILDDWWVLRNRSLDGILATAGHAQWVARPGAAAIFTATFGVIGAHPLALYAVQVMVGIAAAVAVYGLLARFVDARVALGVVVIWQLLPNHSSLDRWPSNVQAGVALALCAVGLRVLVDAPTYGPRRFAAAAALAGSVMTYEATIAAAAVGVVVLPLLARRRLRLQIVAPALVALAGVGAWAVTHSARSFEDPGADLHLVFTIHFAEGIAPTRQVAVLLGLVAAVGVSVVVWRVVTQRAVGVADALVLAGLAVIVVGTLPFVRFPLGVVGTRDRSNVVSGIGGAMAWAGLVALVAGVRRSAGVVVAAALVLVLVPARLDRDLDWARAGDDGVAIVQLLRNGPTDRPRCVYPGPVNRGGVAAFVADWDLEAAWQMQLGRHDVTARVVGGNEVRSVDDVWVGDCPRP